MKGKSQRCAVLSIAFILMGSAAPLSAQSADKVSGLFDKFQWRGVGPAIMGGDRRGHLPEQRHHR
jgi:hypothetical protein